MSWITNLTAQKEVFRVKICYRNKPIFAISAPIADAQNVLELQKISYCWVP